MVLGNDNMYLSRRDCKLFDTLIKKDKKFKKAVFLHNTSCTANEEAWPGQLDKEKDHLTENPNAVAELKATLQQRPEIKTINVNEFSNEMIA